MSTYQSKPGILKNHEKEFVKTYQTYDGNGNIAYIYEAHVDTPNGGECMVVRTAYDGNNRPIYSKEYSSTWDSSWESF